MISKSLLLKLIIILMVALCIVVVLCINVPTIYNGRLLDRLLNEVSDIPYDIGMDNRFVRVNRIVTEGEKSQHFRRQLVVDNLIEMAVRKETKHFYRLSFILVIGELKGGGSRNPCSGDLWAECFLSRSGMFDRIPDDSESPTSGTKELFLSSVRLIQERGKLAIMQHSNGQKPNDVKSDSQSIQPTSLDK